MKSERNNKPYQAAHSATRRVHCPRSTGLTDKLAANAMKTTKALLFFSSLMLSVFTVSALSTSIAYADGSTISRGDAIEIAKQRSGNGKVLSVTKKKNKRGESIFAVKIIKNGRVKVYRIQQNTKP